MKKINLLAWLFYLALFVLFLLPPTDPDLGWHLRCGQEIWTKRSFCSQNQFSVLLEGYSWPNHHWLYQAILFPTFKLSGLWGLTLLNALVMSLAFIFFYLASKKYSWEKILAILLVIWLSWAVFSFGIRSQLLSFLFFNLLLWLLAKVKEQPKLGIFLPPLMLTWTNSHGSVIIGLILLSFFWLREVMIFFRLQQKPTKRFLLIGLLFFFSCLATLINPFGFKIYQEAWRHFALVDLSKLIAEWVPPNPTVWWSVLLTSIGSFFYLLGENKAQNKLLACLVLLFAWIALQARRNLPFYFTLVFYLLFTSRATKTILSPWLKKKTLRDNLAVLTTSLLLTFGLLLQLPQTIEANLSWENWCQKSFLDYPCRAIEFLHAQPEKGTLFNRYEWGGFLIWQLPEYKVFVDGRMPAWPTQSGKSPYTIFLETLQTRPGWQETLDKYHINWILISPETFMDLKLKPNPEKFGWQEVFRDKTAVIYNKL